MVLQISIIYLGGDHKGELFAKDDRSLKSGTRLNFSTLSVSLCISNFVTNVLANEREALQND